MSYGEENPDFLCLEPGAELVGTDRQNATPFSSRNCFSDFRWRKELLSLGPMSPVIYSDRRSCLAMALRLQ